MNDLLQIIEQPLDSGLVKHVFEKYGIKEEVKDYGGFQMEALFNISKSISIDTNESCVLNVTFENLGTITELPFQLRFKDSAAVIQEKLGLKPTSKDKSSTIIKSIDDYHYAWWFKKGHLKILTALNGNYELLWLRFMGRNKHDIDIAAFKKELKNQKKNIVITPDWSSVKTASPTSIWKESIIENEAFKTTDPEEYIENYWFTYELLEIIDTITTTYFEKLATACSKQSPTQIYNAVKWYLKQFNKLNTTYEFIETTERDEICEFIDKTILHTGLQIPKDVDITIDHRDW